MNKIKLLAIVSVLAFLAYPLASQADNNLSILSPTAGQSFQIGQQLNVSFQVSGLTDPIINATMIRYDSGGAAVSPPFELFGNARPGISTFSYSEPVDASLVPSPYYRVNLTYTDSAGHSGSVFSGYISITAVSPTGTPHSPGTSIKDTGGTIYLIDSANHRRPYTSPGAFLSYGFNSWDQVFAANSDDFALSVGAFIPPRDGSIICSDRGAQKGTCYLITEGWKIGFTSVAQFTEAGFSFNNALYGDVSFLPEKQNITSGSAAHLPGTLVSDGHTIYFVGRGALMGIPTAAVLYDWGYGFKDAVAMNSADSAAVRSGILPGHLPGLLSPLD